MARMKRFAGVGGLAAWALLTISGSALAVDSTKAVTAFWHAFGIDRPADLLEVIPVGGTPNRTIDETVLDVEWAGAMAPESRLLVYEGADSYVSTFTQVYDRIVSDSRAAVMTVSWDCVSAACRVLSDGFVVLERTSTTPCTGIRPEP